MSGARCLICGAELRDEAQQMCTSCEFIFKPYAHLFGAMLKKYPVESKGIKYGCISAFIVRTRVSANFTRRESFIIQCELMSNKNSVTLADPKDVTILKGWEYE